jgi:hypothetical protein
VRLRSVLSRGSLPTSLWAVAALVLAASVDLPLIPRAPRTKAPVPTVEERARQPAPPPKPKDKTVDFAPWEEVAT